MDDTTNSRKRLFEARCDRGVSAPAGAGTFLVVELTEQDEDVSYLIAPGTHFTSVLQLQRHLATVTGDDVDVHELEP